MSPKLNGYQNWNVTKAKMSPKLKCHQNSNVTKTKMLRKLKCYQIYKFHQHKNLYQKQNIRDWPLSPWSCFSSCCSCQIFLVKSVIPLCGWFVNKNHQKLSCPEKSVCLLLSELMLLFSQVDWKSLFYFFCHKIYL